MTKLTKQEIEKEKEREAFGIYAQEHCMSLVIVDSVYRNLNTYSAFRAWLARAELAKGGE